MTPDQVQKLNEVHAAIVGNEQLGHKGIAERLLEIELYQEKDKAIKNKAIGGLAILSVIGSYLTHLIAKHS